MYTVGKWQTEWVELYCMANIIRNLAVKCDHNWQTN